MKDEKTLEQQVKEETKKYIETTIKQGIQPTNIDMLFKAVDMYKDMSNVELWQEKEEKQNMRYKGYSGDNYGRENYNGENYGRQMRDSQGRFMARGYDSRYRGESVIDGMYQGYREYNESKNNYQNGNYGAKEGTIESLEYMLQSAYDFICMLKEDANSREELEMIKKNTRKMSEV